jgi:TetR/AcrR family transcriptional repressor of mexJK operon
MYPNKTELSSIIMPILKQAVKHRAGRPKDEGKRCAILEAAGQCFLEHGFTGTSMDTVAREAGVSKLTVYSHFQNKDALFKEVITDKCNQFAPPASFLALINEEPRKALTQIANGFVRLMVSPEVLAMYRVVIGESAKNPKVAGLLHEAGPQRVLEAFVELLRAYVKKGLLDVAEPERAADHFFHMLKGEMQMRLLINIAPPPASAEVQRHVDDCVEVFLRAYGHRP